LNCYIAAFNLEQIRTDGGFLLTKKNIQVVDSSILTPGERSLYAIERIRVIFSIAISYLPDILICLFISLVGFVGAGLTLYVGSKMNNIIDRACVYFYGCIILCVCNVVSIIGIRRAFQRFKDEISSYRYTTNFPIAVQYLHKTPRVIPERLANDKTDSGDLINPVTLDIMPGENRVILGHYALVLPEMLKAMLMRQPANDGIPHPIENRILTPNEEDELCRLFAIDDKVPLRKVWEKQVTTEREYLQSLDSVYREHVPRAELCYDYRLIGGNTYTYIGSHRFTTLLASGMSLEDLLFEIDGLAKQFFHKKRFERLMSCLPVGPDVMMRLGLERPEISANTSLFSMLYSSPAPPPLDFLTNPDFAANLARGLRRDAAAARGAR
jgi:hypothetical protein